MEGMGASYGAGINLKYRNNRYKSFPGFLSKILYNFNSAFDVTYGKLSLHDYKRRKSIGDA